MRTSNEMQIGKAGEYIACADLIIKGLIAYPSEQGLPYDVLIDTGKKLLRCQVKTTEKPRKVPQRSKESFAYIFNIKRHGKNMQKQYTPQEVDVFALVELENRQVVYLTNNEMPSTINLRVDSLRGSYYDEKGIQDYHKLMKEIHFCESQKINWTQTGMAELLGLNVAQINRMLKPEFKPFKSQAKYFSDLEKNKEWFYEL